LIVFYVSGHGFGHASRDVEVINALLAMDPAREVAVRTAASRWLMDLTVRGRVHYHHLECDTGIVQLDSLRLDEDQTIQRARRFMSELPARVDAEASWLRAHDARLVVADIPALGVAAGAAAGVPVAALGNFSWDWAYAAYPHSEDVVAGIAEAYARADVALRLPMWGGFAAFPHLVDLPFVARHSHRDPADTRRALGLPADGRLVLVSFGGYGVEGIDLDALTRMSRYVALVSASVPFGPDRRPLAEAGPRGSLVPIDEPAMYAAGFRYEDLVRAVDVVVTKPGYGIIAECLANDTALLYTSRGHFVEYDVLVEAMPKLLRAAFIDHEDLFAARWEPHLDRLLAQAAPTERPATNGAEVAAGLLLDLAR
jgi:L-arabinokinase